MWAESRTLGIISQASTPRTTGTPRTSLPHFHHPGRFCCQPSYVLSLGLQFSFRIPRPLALRPYSLPLDLAGSYGTRMPGRASSDSGPPISSFSPTQKSAGRPHLPEAWSELSCSWPLFCLTPFCARSHHPCHHVPLSHPLLFYLSETTRPDSNIYKKPPIYKQRGEGSPDFLGASSGTSWWGGAGPCFETWEGMENSSSKPVRPRALSCASLAEFSWV